MPTLVFLLAALQARIDDDAETLAEVRSLAAHPDHAAAMLEHVGEGGGEDGPAVVAKSVRKSAQHAPHNMSVQGKEYRGGEFIPADVMDKATPEEKAKVEGAGEKAEGDQRPPPTGIDDKTKTKVAEWLNGGDKPHKNSPPPLSPDQKKRYGDVMSSVLSRMPAGARDKAMHALSLSGMAFFPDLKSLRDEHKRIGGRSQKGVVGFVYTSDGSDYAKMYLDEGPDQEGTFAHEIAHCVDAGGQLSDKKEWQVAWRAEIKSGKIMLSRYAMTNEAEGFAEFHRFLHERGAEKTKATYPKCYTFWEQEGLT